MPRAVPRPVPRPEPEALLPLSEPVFQILISLAGQDLHGYAIMRDVEERTGGALLLSTSTLYGALQRMRRDGLVQRSDGRQNAPADDDRRRYWRITPFGGTVADAEARRIEKLARMVRGRNFLARQP